MAKSRMRKLHVSMRKIKRHSRRLGRKLRRRSKVALRIGRRVGMRALRRAGRFLGRLSRSGPRKLVKRWAKRKARKLSGRKTVGIIRGGELTKKGMAAYSTPMQRREGRHDIVPGRSIIEWLLRPELGRGRVLALLPGRLLDVEFEQGGRPPSGVAIEEIRVLSS